MPISVEDIEALSEADKEALLAIYRHRCLNADLLYKHCYRQESVHRAYAEESISKLMDMEFLEAVEYNAEQPALFLTQLGISAVRRIMVYPDRWNFTAGDLKMQTFLVRHQMALNAAALDIEQEARNKGVPYEYLDCKFMDYNGNVMPDGMIRFGGCDVFLEMDMNHETVDEMLKKWDHYRAWLESDDFLCKDRKTIVLFLLGNVTRVWQRKASVLKSLSAGLFDRINPMFDVYANTPEVLQRLLFDELLAIPKDIGRLKKILSGHGFTLALADIFNRLLPMSSYSFYARMLSNANHHVVVRDGRAQEFFIEINASGTLPASVFAKGMLHNSVSRRLQTEIGRKIPYLIVGENEKSICRELAATGVAGADDVYFTTLDRLENCPSFPQAICSFDALGRMYNYLDYGLKKPVYMQSL